MTSSNFVSQFIEQRLTIAKNNNPDIANVWMMSLPQLLNVTILPASKYITTLVKADATKPRALNAISVALATIKVFTSHYGFCENENTNEHLTNVAKFAQSTDISSAIQISTGHLEQATSVYLTARTGQTADAVLVCLMELCTVYMTFLINCAREAEASEREDIFPGLAFYDPIFKNTPSTRIIQVIEHDRNWEFLKEAINVVADINTIAGKPPIEAVDLAVPSELKDKFLELTLKQIPIVVSEIEEGIASLQKGNISPFNCSGFRDDVQDIMFTAAGGLGYLNINPFTTELQHEQVCDHSLIYGHKDSSSITKTLLLFKDSICELKDAILTDEVQKPLATLRGLYITLFFYAYSLGRNYGYDVREDWAEVCASNYSKFDREFEDVGPSFSKYFDKGIIVVPTLSRCKQFYAYIIPYDQTVDGKHYPKGKFLKSHKFQEPDYLRPVPEGITKTKVG